nr:NADH dehydrogenase subunit 2 [Malacoctenus macropus]
MVPITVCTFLLALALGTTVTFASSHWLLAWMGLEINTLAILPLMTKVHSPREVEAATKYFLAQAASTAMLLFASTLNAWLTGQWTILDLSHPLPSTLVTLALALKLGMAPLHAWLPDVIQGLNFTTGLIVSTWQKLAPLALLLQIQAIPSNLILALGLLSTLIGGWGGLNQTQVRKILAYSSIAHLGWMTLVLQCAPSLSLLALLTYVIMTTSAFLIFKFASAKTISMLSLAWPKSPILTVICPTILFSLGGLPPLTGFGPKWFIIFEFVKVNCPVTATVAALSALLSLYYYLRLCYAMALTMAPNTLSGITPWRILTTKAPFLLAPTTIAATCLLPLIPLMLALVMN